MVMIHREPQNLAEGTHYLVLFAYRTHTSLLGHLGFVPFKRYAVLVSQVSS